MDKKNNIAKRIFVCDDNEALSRRTIDALNQQESDLNIAIVGRGMIDPVRMILRAPEPSAIRVKNHKEHGWYRRFEKNSIFKKR